MKKKRTLLLLLLAMAAIMIVSSQVLPAHSQPGRDQVHPALSAGNYTFLPAVINQYPWAGLTQWTPWAFEDQYLQEIETGPLPGWLWIITSTGFYRSDDFGFTWDPIGVRQLPWIPSVMAAGQSQSPGHPIFAIALGDIYVSYDLGDTWTLDLARIDNYGFTYLDYVNDVPYASSYHGQVYSRSGPGDWTPAGNALGQTPYDLELFLSTLYAGTPAGLFRLVGDTWLSLSISEYSTPSPDPPAPDPPPPDPSTLSEPWLRQFIASSQLAGTSTVPVRTVVAHGSTLYIATEGARGIYRSTDGQNWTPCDVGLTQPYSHAMRKLIVAGNGRLFAAGQDGVFVSDDGGRRWMALDQGLAHTITGYGVLLDNVYAYDLALLRDEDDQQTLAASFTGTGLWLHTVSGQTLLPDQPARYPPKAVLIVGPIDPPNHNSTRSYISWADKLAAIMAQNGMEVVKIYWPDSTWENVRPAISGASIIVYKGHGFGLGDLPPDPTEMVGSLNGFCLVNPLDPAGARLGTQDMLVATNRLAQNAIGFFFCCSCAGTSAADSTPVSKALARRRIEAYSSTVIRLAGGGYFSGVNEESLLKAFFANPDKTLGELYAMHGGQPDHTYPHVLWDHLSVWFDGDTSRGWSRAFVGDPNLTARDILGP